MMGRRHDREAMPAWARALAKEIEEAKKAMGAAGVNAGSGTTTGPEGVDRTTRPQPRLLARGVMLPTRSSRAVVKSKLSEIVEAMGQGVGAGSGGDATGPEDGDRARPQTFREIVVRMFGLGDGFVG